MVKNTPANTRDMGSIPGQGAKILLAARKLSPCAVNTESPCATVKTQHSQKKEKKQKKKKMLRSRNSNGQIRTKIQTQAVECKSKSKCSPLVSPWGRL